MPKGQSNYRTSVAAKQRAQRRAGSAAEKYLQAQERPTFGPVDGRVRSPEQVAQAEGYNYGLPFDLGLPSQEQLPGQEAPFGETWGYQTYVDPYRPGPVQGPQYTPNAPPAGPVQGPQYKPPEAVVPNPTDVAFDDFVKQMFNTMADMVEARDQALAEGRADVASQYDREIAKLGKEIANARKGQDMGNAAYRKYREKVDPLFDEHLRVSDEQSAEGAEARIRARTDDALAKTDEAQGEATEAFDDLLVKIGADNINLASELHDEAASLDELGESFIVGAGDDAAELAVLHGELIDKTISSLRSDDKFFIESARVQLEKQFGSRIDALKERQAEVASDKSRALADYTKKFNESYGDLPFGNPDQVWDFMAGSWAEKEGWDFQHSLDVNAEVEEYWQGNVRSASEYRKAVTDAIFAENVQQFALDNNMITVEGKLDLVRVQSLASQDSTLRRYLMGLGADYSRRIVNDQYKVNNLEKYDQANRDAANLLDLRAKFVSEYGDLSREVDAFGEFEMNPMNGWVSPVGRVGEWSNSFGYQKPASKGGHIHKGVDIYAPQGSYIYAPEGGEVIGVGTGNISGNYIKIRSDSGIVYYVAHMAGMSHLSKGDRVRAGATVGNVGNTGNAKGTKPHAHFEMRKGNEWINPYTWLNAARDGGGSVDSRTFSYSSTPTAGTSASSPTTRPSL